MVNPQEVIATYLQQVYDAIALHEANIVAAQNSIDSEKKIIADFNVCATTLREVSARIAAAI